MVSLDFTVGNTYQRLRDSDAAWDRSESWKKVHDWTLYVDVLNGDPDAIQRVSFDLGETFQPSSFVCHCPVRVTRPNGSKAWRFATRQQSYGTVPARIQIRGRGGTSVGIDHNIILNQQEARRKTLVQTFDESRRWQPFPMVKLPESQKFGVELELTCSHDVSLDDIADRLSSAVSSGNVVVAENYRAGRQSHAGWKIVPDASIVCSRNQPDCNTFELVSPILHGGRGLSEASKVLQALKSVASGLKINRSMGFHVHVDVSKFSVGQLIKLCQNFIKYEEVMDEFMPPSRRTDSPECDRFFQSSAELVDGASNRQRHEALADCYDLESLAYEMNRDSRYCKLNLQNLVAGRQPTVEFRQHSATVNYEKLSAWVRFCIHFSLQSARLAPPSPFSEQRSVSFRFHALFHYVIKDRALRDFYQERRNQLAGEDSADDCCADCGAGGSCARPTKRANQLR